MEKEFQGEAGDFSFKPHPLGEKNWRRFQVCPTCKGSGFYDGPFPPIEGPKEKPKISKAVSTSSFAVKDDLPVALPKIKCSLSMRSNPVPTSPKYKAIMHERSSETTLPLLPSKAVCNSSKNNRTNNNLIKENKKPVVYWSKSVKNHEVKSKRKIPPIHYCRSRMSSASSEGEGEVETIELKPIENKTEFIRRTKEKLKSLNLMDICVGVGNVVTISKTDENAAYALMPQVNRHLCTMLRSIKVKIVRQACQVIAQLFGRVSHVSRPEFDDIVVLLLNRTADSKTSVRKDAETALNVIVTATPPQVVVRAVHCKGPKSKNAQVRLTTAKIMNTLVNLVGYKTILHHPSLHEMRKRVLETGCTLLNDQNSDVRAMGRELMSHFVTLEDFEDALLLDVPQNIIKNVEKNINWLRVELLKNLDLVKTGDLSSI